jgi:hypothetical protein
MVYRAMPVAQMTQSADYGTLLRWRAKKAGAKAGFPGFAPGVWLGQI